MLNNSLSMATISGEKTETAAIKLSYWPTLTASKYFVILMTNLATEAYTPHVAPSLINSGGLL